MPKFILLSIMWKFNSLGGLLKARNVLSWEISMMCGPVISICAPDVRRGDLIEGCACMTRNHVRDQLVSAIYVWRMPWRGKYVCFICIGHVGKVSIWTAFIAHCHEFLGYITFIGLWPRFLWILVGSELALARVLHIREMNDEDLC